MGLNPGRVKLWGCIGLLSKSGLKNPKPKLKLRIKYYRCSIMTTTVWILYLQLKYSPVSLEYLRTTVLHGTTECAEQFARMKESSRPEINQLDVELMINDDVLVLDVPVNDVPCV